MTTKLKQFREELYNSLPARRDALMDLVDALCSDTSSRSVVELCLNPAFRRGHASVHDGVAGLIRTANPRAWEKQCDAFETDWRRVLSSVLPAPERRPFWLFALDCFPMERAFARTLGDRGAVYQANSGVGHRPVTTGHVYSLLVALPEKLTRQAPPWVVSQSVRRVPTARTALDVGVDQVCALMKDECLPWKESLSVLVADSHYGAGPFWGVLGELENLVVITRLRSNHVFYRQPDAPGPGRRGRRQRYGARFDLHAPITWPEPDQTLSFSQTTVKGKRLTYTLDVWHDLLAKGRAVLELHHEPFFLMRVSCRDQAGELVFRRPLWLGIHGRRRAELRADHVHDAFRQRFDQEHGHRFLRQRVLLDAFQTPVTRHEENWVTLACLAYGQLYAAKNLAQSCPRPWDKKPTSALPATPTTVQRDFSRILLSIGTPAKPPKRRGISPGRSKGQCPGRRTRNPVIYKTDIGRSPPRRAVG